MSRMLASTTFSHGPRKKRADLSDLLPFSACFPLENGITRYARTEQAVAGKAQYTLVVLPHNRAAQIMPTINEP